MSTLKTPIVAAVIGEGGSGGALAIGVADRVLMFEYSTYSVISPEGCAAILWKDGQKAPEAAKSLKLCSDDLYKLKVVDSVITEPQGGAHRDPQAAAKELKAAVIDSLKELTVLSTEELVKRRYEKFRALGNFKDAGAR